jgi:hypothetical protein
VLTGNTRIGTFVQGIDAATAAKLSETLDAVSRALEVIQKGTEPHQHPVGEHPVFQAALHKAQQMCEAGQTEDASRAFMDALEDEERVEREEETFAIDRAVEDEGGGDAHHGEARLCIA